LAQVLGAAFGTTLALISFADQPTLAQADELTWGQVLAELIGTFVLVLIILGAIGQRRTSLIPLLVGGWVTAMVFSSSSTGLLNPAVTLVRGFTDTYTGVPLGAVPLFIGAQLLGALLAVALSTRLLAPLEPKGT
jgi:glycerol uptake facilitator-like aquaporin